ncbi:MAG: lipid A biosynthesis (KDO)2-(lauroyl)-lipid IVA acyltransferase [Odoribacteraceae bacterium]|jgi:predicted LPLAT superfamily acyltransferase|nr:lipid A biosynthesis (KDO)2-(lauroyl)-lipid IVA acyltransferase [Odoribacteraceae bacterium]
MAGERKWKGNTGGSAWGQRGLILLFRLSGLRFAYLVMAAVVPFYMLFSHANYLAIYHYFRRRWGYSRWRSFVETYRDHFVFGQVILDRFAVFAGRKDAFEVEIEGNEHFLRLVNGEKGFIIAGSHVGNFEIAGYLLHAGLKRVNALVYPGETKTVQEHRTGVLGDNDVCLVPVLDDLSHLFTVNAALQRGEIVSMPCDRIFGSAQSVTCDFLGGKADFPMGAFALSAYLDAEVLSIFVLKKGIRKYVVRVRPVRGEGATAREKIAALARSFAGELEAVVRQYPRQWFNYYEFWKDE